jgi:hypothetical protein
MIQKIVTRAGHVFTVGELFEENGISPIIVNDIHRISGDNKFIVNAIDSKGNKKFLALIEEDAVSEVIIADN